MVPLLVIQTNRKINFMKPDGHRRFIRKVPKLILCDTSWLAIYNPLHQLSTWCSRRIRSHAAYVEYENVPVDQLGLMRDTYYPGDISFDPFEIRPEDPEEFEIMVTKELQHGQLAVFAASGFFAQELMDGKGFFEHFAST